MAEKGYFDAEIVVHMGSGHSLFPPKDNSITVMAGLVQKIKENPFEYMLDKDNPSLDTVFCITQNDEMLQDYRPDTIKRIDKNVTAINDYLTEFATRVPSSIPFFQTTQSHAMIHGGFKVNIVPEKTYLRMNYRIVHGNTINNVKGHLEEIVRDFIAQFNGNLTEEKSTLKFSDWDQRDVVNSIGLRALPGSIEPSPITPFFVNGTTPYSVLHGTTRALYGDNITLITPFLMPGNTDTRHYGNLTKHIFRFSPGHDVADSTDNQLKSYAHGVNERANMRGHVNGVKWYSLFIRNMDEADLH